MQNRLKRIVQAKYSRVLLIGVSLALIATLSVGGWFWYKNYAWKQVREEYRRADYEKAAESAKYLPMPNDPADILVYAQVMHVTGNSEKAKTAYVKLVDGRQDQTAMLQLGNLAVINNAPNEAIEWYEKLISANPGYVQAYVNLAVVHKNAGDTATALSVLQRGMVNNPNASALYGLQVSYLSDKKDSPEYRSAVETLKLLDPNNSALTSP